MNRPQLNVRRPCHGITKQQMHVTDLLLFISHDNRARLYSVFDHKDLNSVTSTYCQEIDYPFIYTSNRRRGHCEVEVAKSYCGNSDKEAISIGDRRPITEIVS